MLPDYLPNVHPLLVHFPIALLVAAVALDIAAIARRSSSWTSTATVVFCLGAAALVPTYLSGRSAGDALSSPFPRADALASEHADWAWLTLWAFLMLAGVRLLLVWRDELAGARHVAVTIASLVALFLVYETAEHGGELVYDLGVGVRAVNEAPEGAFDPEPEIDLGSLGPQRAEDGSVRWRFQPGVEAALETFIDRPTGRAPVVSVETTQSALVLEPVDADPVLLLLPESYTDVRLEVRVNVSGFDGVIRLVHHAAGADDYDFLEATRDRLRLGRRAAGSDDELMAADVAMDGWRELAVVGTTTHFRGYVDGELLVHDHTAALPAGRVGLYIAGTGALRLDDLRIFPLAE